MGSVQIPVFSSFCCCFFVIFLVYHFLLSINGEILIKIGTTANEVLNDTKCIIVIDKSLNFNPKCYNCELSAARQIYQRLHFILRIKCYTVKKTGVKCPSCKWGIQGWGGPPPPKKKKKKKKKS